MKATIIFVLIELTAFVLSCLHILPDFGTACLVIGGCFTGVAIGNYGYPRKHPALTEPDLIPPYGLGGYAADAERLSPPQGGDATIPVEDGQDRGYTTKDVADALVMIGRALARQESASDSEYDEPQATYPPMEMKQ